MAGKFFLLHDLDSAILAEYWVKSVLKTRGIHKRCPTLTWKGSTGDLARHEFLLSRMRCFESEVELGCRQPWEKMRWVRVSTFVLVHFYTSVDTDTSSVTHSTSALIEEEWKFSMK